MKSRCSWAATPLSIAYHDAEWGVPLHDERGLFEFLIGSFDVYVWQFVGGSPRRNAVKSTNDVPAKTEESIAMSEDLRNRGFKFAGPTICYAFMQAVGMANDHVVSCFRYREVDS